MRTPATTSSTPVVALAALLLLATTATAQSVRNGCLALDGSAACPGFKYAFVSPGNISQEVDSFGFMSSVRTLAQFDRAVNQYLANTWPSEKFDNELGCSNADSAVIRYQRTWVCGQLTSDTGAQGCWGAEHGDVTTYPKVCTDTCNKFSTSEQQIVANTTLCEALGSSGQANRQSQLSTDYNACALVSTAHDTCITGDSNEANCGYGNYTAGLCQQCSVSPDPCCYNAGITKAMCGYELSASSASVSASGKPTSAASSGGKSKGIGGGAIAGIVIGVLAGLAILAALIWFLLRRRRNATGTSKTNGRRLISSPSEKDLGAGSTANFSSPSNDTHPEVVSSSPPRGASIGAGAGAAVAAGAGAVAAGAAVANRAAATPPPASTKPVAPPAASYNTPPVAPPVASYNQYATPSPTQPGFTAPAAGAAGAVAAAPPSGATSPTTYATPTTTSPQSSGPASPTRARPLPSTPTSRNVAAGAAAATGAAAAAAVGAAAFAKKSSSAPSPPQQPPRAPAVPPAPVAAPPAPRAPAPAPPVPVSAPQPTQPTPVHAAYARPPPPAAVAPAPAPAPVPVKPVPVAPVAAATAATAGAAGVGAASLAATTSNASSAPPKASPGGPVLVNSVKDQAGVDIVRGTRVNVIHPYTAGLEDEITLQPGMKLVVHELYDDGWASGTVLTAPDRFSKGQIGQVGKFPTVCVVALSH